MDLYTLCGNSAFHRTFPLFAPDFWHHHFGKVSAFWALLFAVPFLFAYGGTAVRDSAHLYSGLYSLYHSAVVSVYRRGRFC